jgi:hypothetical protein
MFPFVQPAQLDLKIDLTYEKSPDVWVDRSAYHLGNVSNIEVITSEVSFSPQIETKISFGIVLCPNDF